MKLLELYEGTLFECQMIKNLLENEGILSDFNNENIGTRGGAVWRPGGGVTLVVSDEYYEKAKLIVNEFEKSRKDI